MSAAFEAGPAAPFCAGSRSFDLSRRALIMGILNRTPDSFYEHYDARDDALRRADEIVTEGGEIVDIGGVKAGAGPEVSEGEEVERVCPVVAAVTERFDVAVSVDTWRAKVARAAIEAGASIVNDITGLGDSEMAAAIAGSDTAVVLTHIQGRPRVPHLEPVYTDVVADVRKGLDGRVEMALETGIDRQRIVVDPGLDLGKTYQQSMVLVREIGVFTRTGFPVLLSPSHKGFLGAAAALRVDQRHEATLACVAYGYAQGARIMRVHAVRAAARVCRVLAAIAEADAGDPWTMAVELGRPEPGVRSSAPGTAAELPR